MTEGKMLKDFSENIIMNISSFLLGEPDYLKLKHSNALKILQRKYLKSIYQTPDNYMNVEGFPSWRWYVQPPQYNTMVRRVFTHYLKNQACQIKSLLDTPDNYNDGGVLLEVEYGNTVGYKQRRRIIPSEDKIETVLTSICKDFIDGILFDKKDTRPILKIELHTSQKLIEDRTRRRRRN